VQLRLRSSGLVPVRYFGLNKTSLWAYAEVLAQQKEELIMAYQTYPYSYSHPNLMYETLTIVEPWVRHGLIEAQRISTEHALREAAAVSYLIGRGYPPHVAHQIVESWWVAGGIDPTP
jgi:hypothetical protein